MRFRSFIVGMGVPFAVACGAKSEAPEARVPTAENHSEEIASGSARVVASRTASRHPTPSAHEGELANVEEPFTVGSQIAALERAIELYQAFIVRAGDDPRYTEAVERSKNRIDDARLTICFLLEKPCDEPSH